MVMVTSSGDAPIVAICPLLKIEEIEFQSKLCEIFQWTLQIIEFNFMLSG